VLKYNTWSQQSDTKVQINQLTIDKSVTKSVLNSNSPNQCN